MNILTVNTGSSSVRLSLFAQEQNDMLEVSSSYFEIQNSSPESMLRSFCTDNSINNLSVISHRVVHGGTKFAAPCLVNEEVEQEIDRLSSLAPIHNPIALTWIKACREIFSRVPQVAVFDTGFFSGLPRLASTYAIPANLTRKYDIRRYGFHGLAHKAMLQRWQTLNPEVDGKMRLITLQLGSGCSITAIRDGDPIDTSMGFSPLEGLMMSTRSGDLDPGILLYFQHAEGFSGKQIEHLLNETSGLLGVSEISKDMRILLDSDHPDAHFALDLYGYRAKKYIGAYLAVLEGADAIVFGGGVGENAPLIRRLILKDMEWCGMVLDPVANNETVGKEGCISSPESQVKVWVIPVEEAIILAQEAVNMVQTLR